MFSLAQILGIEAQKSSRIQQYEYTVQLHALYEKKTGNNATRKKLDNIAKREKLERSVSRGNKVKWSQFVVIFWILVLNFPNTIYLHIMGISSIVRICNMYL